VGVLGNAIVLLYLCEASVFSRDGEFGAIGRSSIIIQDLRTGSQKPAFLTTILA
jgi:hypothetical protein